MCYFTKKVLNKRFLPNRKNRWNPPVCTDERFRYVEVECGHCFECRKKKRREWRIRNYEQLKETPTAVFFTGTVSPKRYEHICKHYGYRDWETNYLQKKKENYCLLTKQTKELSIYQEEKCIEKMCSAIKRRFEIINADISLDLNGHFNLKIKF